MIKAGRPGRRGSKSAPWLTTAVELSSVLSVVDGELLIGGQVVPDNQLANLKSEAELLSKMTLWKLLMETVRASAIDQGINKSQNFDHVLVAKAMLLYLDWQREWVTAIKKAQFKK